MGNQLEQFKYTEREEGWGGGGGQFALPTLLLPMHKARYQALSAKSCNVSAWHLDNWLGKSFAAINKLKDF